MPFENDILGWVQSLICLPCKKGLRSSFNVPWSRFEFRRQDIGQSVDQDQQRGTGGGKSMYASAEAPRRLDSDEVKCCNANHWLNVDSGGALSTWPNGPGRGKSGSPIDPGELGDGASSRTRASSRGTGRRHPRTEAG